MAKHQLDDRRMLERVDPYIEIRARRLRDELKQGFDVVDEIGRPGVTIHG